MKYLSSAILIITFYCISTDVYGQNEYLIESETHIFWQPNRKLLMSDFQGGNFFDSKFDRDREIGRSVIPCL